MTDVKIDIKDVEKKLESTISNDQLSEKIEDARMNVTEKYETPPVCLKIDGQAVSTLQNFSAVIGKAKSKKTFLISIAVASALKKVTVLDKFQSNLPDDQNLVLYFDTEQSKFHLQRCINRVLKLSELPSDKQPENLIAFGLRKFSPRERLEMIEKVVYEEEKVGFIVIDGIRDLVYSINNEEEATEVISKLMKWSEELNAHILIVLHQNKGDNNARGHIGTEVINKAETIISVTKDTINGDVSLVETEYSRDREFKPFGFSVDEHGLPFIVDPADMPAEEKKPGKINPATMDHSAHINVLKDTFKQRNEYIYSELLQTVKIEFGRYDISLGNNKAIEFITYYKNRRFIRQREGSKLYILDEDVINSPEAKQPL